MSCAKISNRRRINGDRKFKRQGQILFHIEVSLEIVWDRMSSIATSALEASVTRSRFPLGEAEGFGTDGVCRRSLERNSRLDEAKKKRNTSAA
jgi:hypothetical protein